MTVARTERQLRADQAKRATRTFTVSASDRCIVKRGTWTYNESVRCVVHIVREQILTGSGDYEDPSEIREDREVEHYRIVFWGPTGEPADGGIGFSIQECVDIAQRLVAVEWE
jgi:hypothetical protein